MFRQVLTTVAGASALAVLWCAAAAPVAARDDQSRDAQQADAQQNNAQQDRQDSDRQRQADRDDDETQYRGAEHAALGIMLSERDGQGIRIRDILPDSPAEQAGLQEGDRITKINDSPVNSYRDVVRCINRVTPGERGTISVSRDGRDKSIDVTFAPRERVYGDERQFTRRESNERRNNYDSQRQDDVGDNSGRGLLGVDLSNDRDALVISEVWSASPADKAGLRSGDEILAIDDHKVSSRDALREQLRDHRAGDRVTLRIRRDGQDQTIKSHLVSAQDLAHQMPRQNGYQERDGRFRSDARQANNRGRTGYQRWSINEHHPALGVTLEEDNDGNLTVARVINDGPAASAGVQRGDEILAIDNHDVDSVRDVMRQLSHKQFNDKVTLRVRHDGRKKDVSVTLGDSADFNDRRTAQRADQRDNSRDGNRDQNRQDNRDDDRDSNDNRN
ncbi:MAG TPA: PDZ domain-containing protein [Pirellulales bacterium]